MKLSYLKEFVVISDLLNFLKAARRLYTTQSVLSKHVAKMEGELDVKLLERDSHSMALTEEGRLFGEYARLIVNKYDEALAGLESMAANAGRAVTVGYLAGPFGLFMPKVKESVEARCKGVSLKPRSLGLDNLKKELVEGIDASFGIGAMWLKDNDKPEVRQFAEALEAECDGWLAKKLLLV